MDRLAAPWLNSPALQTLFTVFEDAGATLRLVGGSVRDGLLGLPVLDIDLAVDRDPEWVLACLAGHNITAIPTGITHGTITAIIDKRPYQITSLRVDVKTFGRKAEVAFTEDWVLDATRRDFTINAIYASRTGELFDPVGGLEDLPNRRVRFIGDATLRIQEDYLRILRFFRFSARFGCEPYDGEGMQACAQLASNLPILAHERVTEEMLKILGLKTPLYALQEMATCGVLPYILKPFIPETLGALIDLEGAMNWPRSALVRLAALNPETHVLRLSTHQQKTVTFLTQGHPFITVQNFKPLAYRFQKAPILQLAFLQTAERIAEEAMTFEEGRDTFMTLYRTFATWQVPLFTLTGQDILGKGIPEGPRVGEFLKQVEEWWLARDLQPDRAACLAYLDTLL